MENNFTCFIADVIWGNTHLHKVSELGMAQVFFSVRNVLLECDPSDEELVFEEGGRGLGSQDGAEVGGLCQRRLLDSQLGRMKVNLDVGRLTGPEVGQAGPHSVLLRTRRLDL